jgi:hypothetical protein
MNGKGSKPRPVDEQKFNHNFDKIFGELKLKAIASDKKPKKKDKK